MTCLHKLDTKIIVPSFLIQQYYLSAVFNYHSWDHVSTTTITDLFLLMYTIFFTLRFNNKPPTNMVYVLLINTNYKFLQKVFLHLKSNCYVSLSRSKKMESSYEDLDNASETIDTVELQESAPDKETALLGRRVPRLVRQASIMETPLDSSGSMKMTYWF